MEIIILLRKIQSFKRTKNCAARHQHAELSKLSMMVI